MASPRVSVVIPCRNEARFIESALRTLLDGTYPRGDMEVLVVDGSSSDGTREILERLAAADRRLLLLDNPRRTTPVALNLGIRAARGEIIVRCDGHSSYPPEYVATLVRTLDESDADLVGCPADAMPGGDGTVAQAIALAARGRFATASPFRTRTASGDVDTVPFGCWRRSLFDRVGLFDERLLRNQDNEHSSRILRSGGRVYLNAEMRVRYLMRSTFGELWRHAANGGMWNAFTQQLCPYTFRWRHFLPGLMFLGVVGALALAAFGVAVGSRAAVALGLGVLAPYAATDLLVAIAKARAHGRLHWAALLAFTTASVHFTYGYGIAKGWALVATGGWRRHLGVPRGSP